MTPPISTVSIADCNRVRTLALNRPERLNAFNGQMVVDLATALQQATADPEIRVILLTGSGRAFSAGADLKEVADHFSHTATSPEKAPPVKVDAFAELIAILTDLSKPLVVAVNGVGVGFGMTILGFADVAFMSSEARLRCPFTAIGAPPEAASTYLLPLLLGRQNAAWTLLSSDWITADHALQMGLVWQICSPGDLITTAHRHAEQLAEKPAHILTTVKRLLNAPHREQIAAAAERENEAMSELLGTGSNADALTAFAQR